ncbi:ATP-dependent helicase HrpB [Pseudoxanthomonas sp. CF385]|uniref:ATP-dependent helicase HrpB n=1 Tax=Pseudoxanthomonas sp. CF385 TaxID=1881042 RepID=UPI0008806A8D|nr:ATP-dependent helicase HrpB [Pseudoxanthomonas sp. CF385]SDQ21946.1 ATP-dependent helicase HrpB [Pseudoxanthomonas sp. CF385]
MPSPTFPITPLLPDIVRSLSDHPRLVLEAPPGAGKTTQVPLALLDAPWMAGRKIVVLEPRRVAARAAAGFMAQQRGDAVGETVGYRIRFENKVGPRTRIEVVTEGILTRMIQDDPMLDDVGAILFDEFHERHLAGDLGLALALDIQAQLREDLRLVVMSATLDGDRLARFLDAPRLSSEGRSHPVQVAHFPARRDEATDVQARRAIEHAVLTHPGDVLVFLPGQREIMRVEAMLAGVLPPDIAVLALHGELPVEKQSEALQPDPQGRRRVVLATNVAESSVTLPGVRVVVDSGLAREPSYDPNSGFSRLEVTNISQASADQRAGRAGRVADGWAYRLWPQSQRLDPQRRPEIALVELGALALELAAWGSDDLRFVDAPPPGAMSAARDLLRRLGALTASHAITPLGKRMLALGTHPRLAAMLLSAGEGEDRALACDLAALVEARDPLRMGGDAMAARWRALAAFRGGRAPQEANRSGLAAIEAAAKQWRRRVRETSSPPSSVEAHRLGDVLMHAFPDRIGFQHPQDARRYLLANGRSARLFDDSALVGEPWIVVSELRHEARDALVQRAAPLDERRLRRDFADRFVTEDTVRWDAARRALSAQRESRFDQIVFDARPAGRVDPALAAAALTDAVRDLGLEALPWPESLQQWRERVRCLRDWMQDLGLPDLSDDALMATLDDWLKPAFAGKTRLDALGEDDLSNALKSGLDWALRQRIDQLAPTRITVPSGMERRIEYAHGHPPVLAVKLQELFGLADTPRVADGRVPVLLHLLSPGGKPLQVTSDLRNFWNSTYAEVKKEMKGRYPKHPWPDDPWSAQATHRAKPRGT